MSTTLSLPGSLCFLILVIEKPHVLGQNENIHRCLCPDFKSQFAKSVVSVPADNWWCFVDESVFSRMVDMYKSIVVFLLTGGKTLLVPVFYEDYFAATLRLLEKLHKVT